MAKLTLNGITYESVNDMPPEVRQIHEAAMRRVSAAGPSVTKNELKLSFQLSGPGLKFRMGSGAPPAPSQTDRVGGADPALQPPAGTPPPNPIEPASFGRGLLAALIMAACAAAGLMAWLMMRSR
jgi:hypothetical protein